MRRYVSITIKAILDLHRHVVHPDFLVQATLEFLASAPARRLKRVLIIPGFGNNSSGPRSGIQSCVVLAILAIANVQVERLEGMVFKIISHLSFRRLNSLQKTPKRTL